MNENQQLYLIAREAVNNAYAPYSGFSVGAALLTSDGTVYTGCNIETPCTTNCAERTALYKAISEGKRDFIKIAVASVTDEITYPCGICRQVLYEFMPNGEIIVGNKNGKIINIKLHDLLPFAFSKDNLKESENNK